MTTLYENFIAGTITDAPLLIGATTINASAFADLPVVAAPDIMYIVLDPDASAGAPEIVTVTTHTASATSVTATRGSQSTTAREHAAGTVFRTAFTKADADQLAAIIADGAIGTTNLATGAVTTAKLAADAVDGTKLADDAVNSEHIADGAVDLVHMSANSVDSDQYVDGSVDEVHLNSDVLSGAWTAVTLVNGWVTATGFDAMRYKKVGNTVFLYGKVDGSAATNIIIGSLPVGFRPAAIVQGGASFGEDVAPSGAISATTGTSPAFFCFFEAA